MRTLQPITPEEENLIIDYIQKGYSIFRTVKFLKEQNIKSHAGRVKKVIEKHNLEYRYKQLLIPNKYKRKQLTKKQKIHLIEYCKAHDYNENELTYLQVKELFDVFNYGLIIDGLLYCLRTHRQFSIKIF